MNRRHFLQLSSAALSAFALDPERLLWVPGRKTIIDCGVRAEYCRLVGADGTLLAKWLVGTEGDTILQAVRDLRHRGLAYFEWPSVPTRYPLSEYGVGQAIYWGRQPENDRRVPVFRVTGGSGLVEVG